MPDAVVTTVTVTLPGSTVYVSGNSSNASTLSFPDELTGPTWCSTSTLPPAPITYTAGTIPAPFSPVPSGSPATAESYASPPAPITIIPHFSSTVTFTSTKKTSVVLTAPSGPPVEFPTNPPNPPNQRPETSPLPTPPVNSSPQRGPGPSPGLQPSEASFSVGGPGQLVSSALAAAHSSGPVPDPASRPQGPGSGGGSSGGSSPGSASGPSLGDGAVVNGIPVSQGSSSDIVIGRSTFHPTSTPTAAVINGQTFTILPSNAGVVAPGGITIPASPPLITPAPSFPSGIELNPSNPNQVLIDGTPISIPSSGSTIVTISGTAYALNPTDLIIGGSSTLAFSSLSTSLAGDIFSAETIDGIAFDIGSTLAVIDGQTILIGPGAPTSTLVVGSETIIAGPNGLIFPDTTAAPLPTQGVVDGLTLGLEPSAVVISGTTYGFARPTTLTLGSDTVVIGTGGVNVDGKTVEPEGSTAGLPSLTQVPGPMGTAQAKATPTSGAARPSLKDGVGIYGVVILVLIGGLAVL